MDMLSMTFADDSFDVIIDKATMDALMVDEGDVWNPCLPCREQGDIFCKGISRVLKSKGRK